MADTKRNSLTSKVAIPKSPATPPQQAESVEALSKAIGSRIKITTAGPSNGTVEGTLFTACPILNVVAIDTRAGSSNKGSTTATGDYKVIPFSRITNFQVLALPQNGDASRAVTTPAIGQIDTKRVQERLDAKIRKMKEDEANRGKGVSKQAQAIFDALKRVNIPIRWHDQSMVAYEAVIISAPYTPEDCKASKDKQQVLNQVKRVLEGETKKLKERESKATAPTGSQRKGG